AHATSREVYVGHTIYNIASQGRTVRVSQIGYDMVAVSNTPTTEQIHSILDRHRAAALPFSGSSLLERHYHDVPLLSLVWGVGQIGLPFSESGSIHVFGFALPLEEDSTIIASIAPSLPVPGALAALRVKVEEIAPAQDKAASQAADLNSLLTLLRGLSIEQHPNAANSVFQELLKNAQITQHGERVVITSTVAAGTLAHL
ncbi:MAG TPA: hypothetical protein VGG45_17220, partial [Terracidiphilus sp.]